jgi:hypothetical protein
MSYEFIEESAPAGESTVPVELGGLAARLSKGPALGTPRVAAAAQGDFAGKPVADLSVRNNPSVAASFVKKLARDWTGRLAHYAAHRNDEHRLALFDEAVRYAGLHLENDLARSEFWSESPLAERAAVLLFLVDRGVIERMTRRGRRVFEPLAHAESWVENQPALRSFARPMRELLAALRLELLRRAHSRQA